MTDHTDHLANAVAALDLSSARAQAEAAIEIAQQLRIANSLAKARVDANGRSFATADGEVAELTGFASPSPRFAAAAHATDLIRNGGDQRPFPQVAAQVLEFLEPTTKLASAHALERHWLDTEAEWLIITDLGRRPWILTADEDGEPFAVSWAESGPDGERVADDTSTRRLSVLDYPVRIVHASTNA